VSIIGILAGVGVLTYNSYMEQAKYNAILTNFDIVSENTDLFIGSIQESKMIYKSY
jgi:hypothetical protein